MVIALSLCEDWGGGNNTSINYSAFNTNGLWMEFMGVYEKKKQKVTKTLEKGKLHPVMCVKIPTCLFTFH